MRLGSVSVRGAVAALALGLIAGCGPDASSAPSTVATVASVAPAADFGSTFVGQPVAFWFWAPY